VKKVDVYYAGWGEYWRLGQLASQGVKVLFEYSAEALQNGLELSPLHLKLRTEAYRNFPDHQMNLPGLIADSLPDGWGLLLMDKVFRRMGIPIAEVSPLDRLSFLGSRTVGALCFEPASTPDSDLRKITILKLANETQKITRGEASTALLELAVLGGSPQGARPKVLVDYDPKEKTISTSPSLNERQIPG
jgi:serine/threonine-protein kinase HipA